MKIASVVVGYRNLSKDRLRAAYSSLYDLLPIVFTHSDEPTVIEAAAYAHGEFGATVFDYRRNRGLSRSWNDGIIWAQDNGCDTFLIWNDDILFGQGDVDLMIDTAIAHRNCYMITPVGAFNDHSYARLNYSCFALNPIAIEKIGYFDRNFWPAYFEDNDYAYRADLLGLPYYVWGVSGIMHNQKKDDASAQIVQTFFGNRIYYQSKWGGLPEQEKFKTPFDDPVLTPFIGRDSIDYPYGQRDRNLSFALEML